MNKITLIKLSPLTRSSYWFVPILMMVLAMWLGIALVKLDKAGQSALFVKWGWGHFSVVEQIVH
jgi:hypothetical protein